MAEIAADDWKCQYCKTCDITMPLRSKHCFVSDRCIATFDHHCDTINTPIGERNHTRFYLFIVTQFMLLVYSACMAITGILDHHEWSTYLKLNGLAIFMVIVISCIVTSVGGLVAFHTFLLLTNLTSNEIFKADKIRYFQGDISVLDLPFSSGCCGNMRLFCCGADDLCRGGCGSKYEWTHIIWRPPKPWNRRGILSISIIAYFIAVV